MVVLSVCWEGNWSRTESSMVIVYSWSGSVDFYRGIMRVWSLECRWWYNSCFADILLVSDRITSLLRSCYLWRKRLFVRTWCSWNSFVRFIFVRHGQRRNWVKVDWKKSGEEGEDGRGRRLARLHDSKIGRVERHWLNAHALLDIGVSLWKKFLSFGKTIWDGMHVFINSLQQGVAKLCLSNSKSNDNPKVWILSPLQRLPASFRTCQNFPAITKTDRFG